MARPAKSSKAKWAILHSVPTIELYRELSRRGAMGQRKKLAAMTPEQLAAEKAKRAALWQARKETCRHTGRLRPLKGGKFFCHSCMQCVPAPRKVVSEEFEVVT